MAVGTEMRLVAVYDDELDAVRAVGALQRVGITLADMAIEHPEDHEAPVQAELRPESVNTVGAILGVLAAVPFAAFEVGGLDFWSRCLFLALIGAALGATIGAGFGRGFGARRSPKLLAVEPGITVAVTSTPRAQSTLLRTHPVRIDLVDPDGNPVEVLADRVCG
jgi:hypothetical protein